MMHFHIVEVFPLSLCVTNTICKLLPRSYNGSFDWSISTSLGQGHIDLLTPGMEICQELPVKGLEKEYLSAHRKLLKGVQHFSWATPG